MDSFDNDADGPQEHYPGRCLERAVSDIVADIYNNLDDKMSDDDGVSLTYEEYCEQAIILQQLREIEHEQGHNVVNRQENTNALRIADESGQLAASEKLNVDGAETVSSNVIMGRQMVPKELTSNMKKSPQSGTHVRKSLSEGEVGLRCIQIDNLPPSSSTRGGQKSVSGTQGKCDYGLLNNVVKPENELPPKYFTTDSRPVDPRCDSYIHNDLLKSQSSSTSHHHQNTKKRQVVPTVLIEELDRKLTYINDIISFTRGYILGGDQKCEGCSNVHRPSDTGTTHACIVDEDSGLDRNRQDKEILNSIKQIIIDLSEEIEKFRHQFRSYSGDFLDAVAGTEKQVSCPSDLSACIDKQATAIDRMRKEKRSMKNKLMAKEREWTASNHHLYEEIRSLRQHVTQIEAMLAGQCRSSGRRHSIATALKISEDLNMALSLDAIKQNKINELKLLAISQHHYISSLEDRNADLERALSLLMKEVTRENTQSKILKNEMQELLKCDNAEYLPGKVSNPELASYNVHMEPGSTLLNNKDNEENEFQPLRLSYIKHNLEHSLLDDEVLELHDFLTNYGPGSKNFSLME